MGGDTPPSPLRVQTAPSVTGRPRFPRLTVGVHAEQAPAAAFPGGGAARTATSVPAISRLPPRWPCAHVCPPPQPGGSSGRDGEAALLSPCRAQGQTQGQDGLALLLVVTATATRAPRVLAVRAPAQGPAHSTRSGLHVAQARTAGCPPRMHRPRTRRAARGLLRGPPAHGPDRSRQKGKRDVEARGRERGQEDGRACADRGSGRTASVPGEGCWGRGAHFWRIDTRVLRPSDLTTAPQSLVQVCPGDFSAASGPHRGGVRCEVLV